MKKYKFIDHTADIAVEVYGADYISLFANAFDAYCSAVANFDGNFTTETITITVKEDDYVFLLVEFLSELNYNLQVEKQLPVALKELKVDDNFGLTAIIEITDADNPEIEIKEEIKAVTYHDLNIEQENSGFKTTIVFDI